MSNILDTLQERGLVEQLTHADEIRELLDNEKVAFYIGFDPTADSLHVGHFTAVLAMMRMQQAGHIPIVLIGGGTAMVGDPTGKIDMRRIMTKDEIDFNASCFKKQLSKFIDFNDDKAFMVNNADWLLELNYVEFLRNVGVHFSVNRMLTAEAFKSRMEKGLSFLEFNYMLMQSYDFLELNNRYNCKMQLGGNDQWSNIIGGVELIRKVKSTASYGMTFSLLTTSEGKKMGKTESGAVWLDADKTSPYDFYQYWRNVDDRDVRRCFCLLTFYSMDEIAEFCDEKKTDINRAKEILAFSITSLVHGENEAINAQTAAKSLFAGGVAGGSIPTAELDLSKFEGEIGIVSLLTEVELVSSKSDARRLIKQGGIKIDNKKIDDVDYFISKSNFNDNSILIQKGKKVFLKVTLI